LQAGATGYLLKDADSAPLIEAIRETAAGQLSLTLVATHALIHSFAAAPPRQPAGLRVQLSERKHDVLARVVAGKRTKEIAEELIISPNTVKYHVQQLYNKLGVSSRADLVREALRNRLIQ
jgi:DNA-binding NarL/FixJ family response regulator